jgi:hypothetical protein
MPWRLKPKRWLRYWAGATPAKGKAAGFKTVLIYCLGPPSGFGLVVITPHGYRLTTYRNGIGTTSALTCAAKNATWSATSIRGEI